MDFRVFNEVECEYCQNLPHWRVFEDRYSPDFMLVCDEHKYLPYS